MNINPIAFKGIYTTSKPETVGKKLDELDAYKAVFEQGVPIKKYDLKNITGQEGNLYLLPPEGDSKLEDAFNEVNVSFNKLA